MSRSSRRVAGSIPGQARRRAALGKGFAHELDVRAETAAGRLDHYRRSGGPDHRGEHLRIDRSLAQSRVAVRSGPGRISRIVRMQQIDLPDDGADPVDRVRELLAGGVRVAGVEAEADVDTRLRAGDRVPEQR